jgi:hypothetical protein
METFGQALGRGQETRAQPWLELPVTVMPPPNTSGSHPRLYDTAASRLELIRRLESLTYISGRRKVHRTASPGPVSSLARRHTMDTSSLLTKFARMGARLKVRERPASRFSSDSGVVALDVREDRHGEYFEIARQPGIDPEVAVLDIQSTDRHLLLLVRDGGEKQKFLCGHDERHWFVAAVPEKAPVGTVWQAKEALKPAEVLAAQSREGLRRGGPTSHSPRGERGECGRSAGFDVALFLPEGPARAVFQHFSARG